VRRRPANGADDDVTERGSPWVPNHAKLAAFPPPRKDHEMRHLALLLSTLTLFGCATKPPVAATATAQRNPCTNGILALYFKEEAAALRPPVSMEWPARAMEECPGAAFKVVGLPEPSAANLQGRRA